MSTAVYRHFDADGHLLYVGVTNDPKRRLAEHKCRSVWADQIADISVKWVYSREDALAIEAEAIATEAPIFNGGQVSDPMPTGDAMRDWMAASRVSQQDIATAYGVSGATISHMISGKRRVSLKFAVFIEDITEGAVPCRYWMFGATAEAHGSAGDVVVIGGAA